LVKKSETVQKMVTIKYNGRTGNKLFSYCFARILAIKNNLKLETEWPDQDFLKTTPHEPGEIYDKPVVKIRDLYWDDHQKDHLANNYRKHRVYCDGFFQNCRYYNNNKELVKTFFELPPIKKRSSNEIVAHWRIGDYHEVRPKGSPTGSVIRQDWYTTILMHKLKFNIKKNKLYIVTDSPNDKLMHKLHRFRPEIIHQSPKDDFNFIRQFDNIICGNSSFSWFAAYLSDAKKIFTFSRWINEPHKNIVRLAGMRGATQVQGNWI